MGNAERISGLLRVDRLDTGERKLVRPLVIDMNEPVPLGGFRHEWVTIVNGNPQVTVPDGFVTDFSSIPWIFRPLYRFSAVDLAGCVHDLAYRIQMPRKAADRMWEIVATSGETNCNKVTRRRGHLGYWALRIGGKWAYTDNATRDPFDSGCDSSEYV